MKAILYFILKKLYNLFPFGKKSSNNTIQEKVNEVKNTNLEQSFILEGSLDKQKVIDNIVTLYITGALREMVRDTLQDYENEKIKQKLFDDSKEQKLSENHRKVTANTEKLLKNNAILERVLSHCLAKDADIKQHLKEILRLNSIEKVVFKTKK